MSARVDIAVVLARFRKDEKGATLVEFAMVIALFLFIFFGLIDFGRLAFHWVMAERAMSMAARVAAVRPPVCSGVPDTNLAGGVVPPARFGTLCSAAAGTCSTPPAATLTCPGNLTNATSVEIWNMVADALPDTTTSAASPANIQYTYSFDPNLGFLGGPYIPIVTVELNNLDFEFISAVGGLASIAGFASGTTAFGTIPFPSMSVSLPGEDLALGTNG